MGAIFKQFPFVAYEENNDKGQGEPAPAASPPAPTPPEKQSDSAAAAEVVKAYEKLRASEATVKELKPKAEKADTLQSKVDQLESENTDLKKQIREGAAQTVIAAEARRLNFLNPDRALNALRAYTDVDPLTLDTEAKVKTALMDLSAKESYLVGAAPPSGGPVQGQGQNQGGNAAVNAAIRRASGR